MALWQGNSRRSKTGRRIRFARGKKKFEIGREKHLSIIGPARFKKVRTMGDNRKMRVKATNVAYVIDPENNKTTKTKQKVSLRLDSLSPTAYNLT